MTDWRVRLEEALAEATYIDNTTPAYVIDEFAVDAVRLVAAGEELDFCEVHESKIVGARSPGGNPGLYRCDRAEIQMLKGQDGVAVCKLVSKLLVDTPGE